MAAILFIIILQVFDRDVKENTITAVLFSLFFLVLKCRNEKSYLIKAKKDAIISAYFDGWNVLSGVKSNTFLTDIVENLLSRMELIWSLEKEVFGGLFCFICENGVSGEK